VGVAPLIDLRAMVTSANVESTADDRDSFLRAVAAAPEIPVVVLAPGTVVQGRFRIEARLGRGGMGVVWRAHDLQLDRKVAIKVGHRNAGDLARLRQEARVLASLSHPNVVTVLGVGLHDDATFIAMELVEGGTARTWLAERPRAWPEIVALYRQAGAGLAAAHGVGIVHRDFKPDNVLVGRERDGSLRARVADFGIARADEQVESLRESESSSTDEDTVAGTPGYMAPEQREGSRVDARADQYAFCVALAEALRGRGPAWIDRVLQRGLERDPLLRWPSMEALLARLTPRRRFAWVRLAVPAGVVLAIAGVLATRDDAAACASAGRSPWTPERARAIDSALHEIDVPAIDDIASTVHARLAAHEQAWTRAWAQTCAQGEVPRADTMRECLRARNDELAAVLDVLADADRSVVRRIDAITDVLGDPAQCLDDPQGAARLSDERDENALADAQLSTARVTSAAGRYHDAITLLAPVLAEAQRIEDRPLIAAALLLRGTVWYQLTEYESADADFDEAYALALAEHLDDLAVRAASSAASSSEALGRQRDARTWCSNARSLFGSADVKLGSRARALGVEAHVLAYTDELERAETVAREAVALLDEAPLDDGRISSERHDALAELAHVLYRRGKFPEAMQLQREVLALAERRHGADHPRVAAAIERLGLYALHGERREESRAMLERALASSERWFGPDDPVLIDMLAALAHLDTIENQNERALARLERARRIAVASHRPEVPTLVGLDDVIGLALLGLGRDDEAVEVFRREADALARVRGPNDPELRFVLNNAAVGGQDAGRLDEAEAWLRQAIAIDDGLPERDYQSGALHVSLAFVLIERKAFDAAEVEAGIGKRYFELTTLPDDPDRAWPPFALGRIEALRGHPERAVPLFDEAMARWDLGTRAESYRELRKMLAVALWDEGRDRARAITLARELLSGDPDDPELGKIVAEASRMRVR
jgi:eukaryotic-like serine/threonine-protein kinase